MSIYLAAGIIGGAVLGLGASVVLKIVVRELLDARSRAVQLPLPRIKSKEKEEEDHLQPA